MKTITLFTYFALILFGFISCANSNGADNSSSNEVTTAAQQSQVQHIDQDKLHELMQDTSVVVIDVRTQGEIQQGYIQGADLFIDFRSSDFQQKIDALDKSKSYVMYCRSGGRSSNAANFMVNNGFTSVYNLKGGIMGYTGDIAR